MEDQSSRRFFSSFFCLEIAKTRASSISVVDTEKPIYNAGGSCPKAPDVASVYKPDEKSVSKTKIKNMLWIIAQHAH